MKRLLLLAAMVLAAVAAASLAGVARADDGPATLPTPTVTMTANHIIVTGFANNACHIQWAVYVGTGKHFVMGGSVAPDEGAHHPYAFHAWGLTPDTVHLLEITQGCGGGAFTMHYTTHPVSAPASLAVPQGPDRYGFCAVAGNTDLSGKPIAPGTFLNLEYGQATTDMHYKGATPAFWVDGLGITCSLTPAQAAIASATTGKVNHVGKTGDYNLPDFYVFIPKA